MAGDSELDRMVSYRGSLRIAATADVIEAVFVVDDQRLTVNTGDEALGSWPLVDLRPSDTGNEVLLALDGEQVAVNVVDHEGFVAALSPQKPRRKARHSKPTRSPRSAAPKPARERRGVLSFLRRMVSRDVWRKWLSDTTVRWVIASAVVVGVAGMAVFATNSLGMILVLMGMVVLIIAALAVSEDLSAYSWIPGNLSEVTLVIAGAIAMAIGGVLIAIG